MTYRGSIKNGVAVLDSAVTLPEGTCVRVEVEPAASEFWVGKTVEELSREQGVESLNITRDLTIDRSTEELVGEFLTLIREVRH